MGCKEPDALIFNSWLTDWKMIRVQEQCALGRSVREWASEVGSGLGCEEESEDTGTRKSRTPSLLLTDLTRPCSGEDWWETSKGEQGYGWGGPGYLRGESMGTKYQSQRGRGREFGEVVVWSVCVCFKKLPRKSDQQTQGLRRQEEASWAASSLLKTWRILLCYPPRSETQPPPPWWLKGWWPWPSLPAHCPCLPAQSRGTQRRLNDLVTSGHRRQRSQLPVRTNRVPGEVVDNCLWVKKPAMPSGRCGHGLYISHSV